MEPEEIFDNHQKQEGRLLTRRGLLRKGALGAVGALASPSIASAGISALMCPPQAGSFGGNAAGFGPAGGGLVEGGYDYSGAVPDDGPGLRHLTMTNWATGETYDRDFVVDGQYVQDALEEFANFARDRRQNQAMPIDPAAIDIVWNVWRKLGISSPLNLNSGYRSPKTNASLKGAAKQSYHMKGMALDISTGAASVNQIHAAAISLKAGGVGKYTEDKFVHVDSGPKRYWGS